MTAVTFEMMNKDGVPPQAPYNIDVDVIPRQGEVVYFFDRFSTVKNIRHEFTKSPRNASRTIHTVTVVLETY